MMRWATGAEAVEVSSIGDTLSGQPIDVEDVAAVALRFEGGMVGSLHGAYATDRATDGLFFALRGGQPLCTIEDALRVLETLDAAYESARTGRHVRVQPTR